MSWETFIICLEILFLKNKKIWKFFGPDGFEPLDLSVGHRTGGPPNLASL